MFQSFWCGDSLSPYEVACMRSFVDNGHRFVLYTYQKDLRVPEGVERRDAAALIEPEAYFTYGGAAAGSHALFSNLFRYKLLTDRGGWWVDTDVVCLSHEIPCFEIFAAFEDTGRINGAVLRLPKGHPVARNALHKSQVVRERAQWGELGPELVTELFETHGLASFVQPMPVCYPIHYTEAIDLLRPSRTHVLRERVRGSLFLHLWNEMFRLEQVDKMKLPPAGSLLREIFDRHPCEAWNGEYGRDDFEKPRVVNELEATVQKLTEQSTSLAAELARERDALASERDALVHSRSWRYTRPFRTLRRFAGRRKMCCLPPNDRT